MKKYMVSDFVKELTEEEYNSFLVDYKEKLNKDPLLSKKILNGINSKKITVSKAKAYLDGKMDNIEQLVFRVNIEDISLATAQEEAWAEYGYSEGGTKSGSSKSRWGERVTGGSNIEVTVDYEPMFESLGTELDDDPIWTITRLKIKTNNQSYPRDYEISGKYEHSKESIDFLEENSPLKWFNEFVSDQRFT